MSGKIPPELGNLTELKNLDLGTTMFCGRGNRCIPNQMSGEIPPKFGNLTNLEYLRLDGNSLEGEVPVELSRLTKATTLDFSRNELTGEVSEEFGDFPSNTLDFWGNDLTGCISTNLSDKIGVVNVPVCETPHLPEEAEALVALYRAWGEPGWGNWLTRDPIGAWDGVSTDLDGRVVGLNLYGFEAKGEMPKELLNLTNLKSMDLNYNGISGRILPEVGNLTSLKTLLLRGNQLTGEIPKELGNLTDLNTLDLRNNQLTGEIPRNWGTLPI